MDNNKNPNFDEILQHLEMVKATGKVNFYSVKYSFRNRKDNFAVCLPDNMNGQFLQDICDYLVVRSERKCMPFNPVSCETETYERIPLNEIQSHWINILKLIEDAKGFKDGENKKIVSEANLSVCLLQYRNTLYYICSKQKTLTGLLRGKRVLMSCNDKLELVYYFKLFLLNGGVDFIVCGVGLLEEQQAFIFERENFFAIFNYYEHLKRSVQEKLFEIDQWKFLESAELIRNKSNQKNVYLNLSKVFSDQEYLQQMKQVHPAELKKRLINKSDGSFTENDFEGEKLLVTAQNLEKVMRMLAKGFKYNFFTDKAEEL